LENFSFQKYLAEAWMKAGAEKAALAGYKRKGIYPLNSYVLLERAFAPSSVSDRLAVEW
jgi:hypothetical protein